MQDQCKTMYIELLEKVFNAFNRIPQCIKKKFPAYDENIYLKIKRLRNKLRTIIESKPRAKVNNNNTSSVKLKDNFEPNDSEHSSPSMLQNYNDDLDDFDLESSQIGKKAINRHTNKLNNKPDTSTPETIDFNNKPSFNKTIYSEINAKKSLSFEAFSPTLDTTKSLESSVQSENDLDISGLHNKNKSKFVFKRPSIQNLDNSDHSLAEVSSTTMNRLRNATDKLKPLVPLELPKQVILNNSSLNFQPTNSLLNKPCTIVPPIVNDLEKDYLDEIDDYEVRIDMDYETDLNNPESQDSVINLSDSLPSTSVMESGKDKENPIDDDGWPEYRIEDFEEDIVPKEKPDSGVVNLMEQSMVKANDKYQGIGDFHPGTKNDGITGVYLVFSINN